MSFRTTGRSAGQRQLTTAADRAPASSAACERAIGRPVVSVVHPLVWSRPSGEGADGPDEPRRRSRADARSDPTDGGCWRVLRPSYRTRWARMLVPVTAEQIAQAAAQSEAGPADGPALTTALDLAFSAVGGSVLPGAGRWWVTGGSGGIELRAAIGAHLPLSVQRATRLAAGSALLAARLAVAVSGARPFTTLVPDSAHPGLLAVLRSGNSAEPTQAERALFGALVCPRTTRPDLPVRVTAALPLLRHAVNAEGAWVRSPQHPTDRARMAALVQEEASRGGSCGPLLVVVGSHHGLPAGDLQAGQAVQRLLLTARTLGLRGAVLLGPVGLAARRARDVPGAGPGLMPLALVQVRPDEEGPSDVR